MKHRIRFEIKSISEQGYFEGLLSPYGTVDAGNDLVEAGAFTKTLKEKGVTRPLLWQHKRDVPIGELTLEDRPEGLWCKGQLLMDLAAAREAYLLIKARIVRGLSIGFLSVKDTLQSGVRRLKEINLFEGSVVTFPMHEGALITSVKGREEKADFNQELADVQLSDAGWQIRTALSRALDSLMWAPLTKEQKVAAAEVVLSQFTDAYMAYLPLAIDMMAAKYGPSETWARDAIETKEGRRHSAATREVIQAARDQIAATNAMISALIDDEAGEATPESKAATKPEPVDHSALNDSIDKLRGALTWNN